MPTVTFITPDQNRITIENADANLMEIAQTHAVPGIDGDCGGVCSCSTCHVYIPDEWRARVGPPGEDERTTLDFNDAVRENSRLSCQIEMTEALDGLVVEVAPSA